MKTVAAAAPLIALVDPRHPEHSTLAVERGAAAVLRTEASFAEVKKAIELVLCRFSSEIPPPLPFIGTSRSMQEAVERIKLYASYDYPVLILGESGTGKELAARALHKLSRRREGPFIGRNCAALPNLLAESELFGTERGAFTDAVCRAGAFELARGGVLFLDEIGDMKHEVQAKLLRALETGEIWPLGGREPRRSDLRLISATSLDIETSVREGNFRSDLYYRVNTLIIRLPPLREYRDDIPDLAAHFVNEATSGKVVVSAQALRRLVAYDWPGNVRQLRSVLQRALVHSRDSGEIAAEHIEF